MKWMAGLAIIICTLWIAPPSFPLETWRIMCMSPVAVILGVYAVRRVPQRMIVLPGLYLLSWAPSVLLSSYVGISLLGNPFNHLQGWVTELMTIGCALGIAVALRGRDRLERWTLALAMPLCGYAMTQFFQLDPLPWQSHIVHGTFGNSDYLASYLAMLVPFTVGWLPVTIIVGTALLLTMRRGPLLEMVPFLGYLLIIGARKRTRILILAGPLVPAIIGVFLMRGAVGGMRVTAWQSVWPVAIQRPIVGWGPETMSINVTPNDAWQFTEGHLTDINTEKININHASGEITDDPRDIMIGQQSLIDPSHNSLLDIFYGRGIVGLLGFVPIVLLMLRAPWKAYPFLAASLGIHLLDSLYNVQPEATMLLAWTIVFSVCLETPQLPEPHDTRGLSRRIAQ